MIEEKDLDELKTDIKNWVSDNFVKNSKCESIQTKTTDTIHKVETSIAVISSDLKSIKWLLAALAGAAIANMVGTIFDRLVG